MSKELVIHPEHYQRDNRPDCWTEMRELFGEEAVSIFDTLNAYKYHYRAGLKEGNSKEQDIRKMYNYLEHSHDMIENDSDCDLARYCYKKMMEVLDNGK